MIPLRAIAALILLASYPAAPTARAEPIKIAHHSVALNADAPAMVRIGRLVFRGGLALRSRDGRFGGLSDLAIGRGGRNFMAVTDAGDWIGADLIYGPKGRLAGIANGRIHRLLGPGGRAYPHKRQRDAEALIAAKGRILVGFEHVHRLWAYPTPGSRADWYSHPQPVPIPAGLRRAPANQGLEAAAALGGGRLLLLTEGLGLARGGVRGWVGRPGAWRAVAYRPAEGFRPTGAAALPGGDVLILERRASLLFGLAARIVTVPRAALARGGAIAGTEIAMLHPPLTVDNFEGIAVRPQPGGRVLIYLVSDDNFSILQRTLLLMFELTL